MVTFPIRRAGFKVKLFQIVRIGVLCSMSVECERIILKFPLQHINVKAFRPFVNLRSLQVTDIARNEIRDLCDTLTAIDVINLDKYDVSCFQLTLNASFEDSTVIAGISSGAVVEETFDGSFLLSDYSLFIRPTVIF